jgi:hypothetical protein
VGEAPHVQDPQRAARLEANKLRIETAKTQLLIASGSLVGIAAVVGVLPTSNQQHYLLAAFVLIGISVFMAFAYMEYITRMVEKQRSYSMGIFMGIILGPWYLGWGLISFGIYAYHNIPFEHRQVELKELFWWWSNDPVAFVLTLFSIVGVVWLFVVLIVLLINLFMDWRRGLRERRRQV